MVTAWVNREGQPYACSDSASCLCGWASSNADTQRPTSFRVFPTSAVDAKVTAQLVGHPNVRGCLT
jgi:hypothetical protein